MRPLFALAAVAALGCATPTAINVSVASEVGCDAGATSVLVGSPTLTDLSTKTPASTSTQCVATNGGEAEMGNVVVVPVASKNENVAFAVMTRPDGQKPDSCLDPTQASHCIVAKRELRFIPQTELAMRVDLRLSCLGIVCSTEQTCVKGTCVGAQVPPSCPPPCGDNTLVPSSDAGALDARDANDAAPLDATLDAADGTDALDSADTSAPDVFDAGTGDALDAAVADAAETSPSDADAGDTTVTGGPFTIGGTVAGLAPGDSLKLQDNGGNSLFVTMNGPFVFATPVPSGSTYSVTAFSPTAPTAQTCTVTSGSGTASANVTDIAVTCTLGASFTVGGTLKGLAAGDTVVLQENGGDNAAITGNGLPALLFGFPAPLADNASYTVTVLTQPTTPSETCVVTAGSGSVAGSNVTNVLVTCVTDTHTIGGTITGLAAGDSVVLQDNGGDNVMVMANGSFAFSTPIASGAPYAVTVLANPAMPVAQTCTVATGSGTVGSANVTGPTVTCVTKKFTVGGTLAGLAAGDTVVLQDNGGDDLSLGANGAFTFVTSVASAQPYNATVLTNPTSPAPQTCTVMAGAGTLGAANVTGVQIACSASGLVTLASGQSQPFSMALDATNVYWTNQFGPGGVQKVPKAGGAATPLGASGQLFGIAVDGTSVYWTDQATVRKAPVNGGATVTIAAGQQNPQGLAVDANNVYFTTYGFVLASVPLGGGTVTTLAMFQNDTLGIAVDATSVYLASPNDGEVAKVPIGGGIASALASPTMAVGLAIDAANAYWTTLDGNVMSLPLGGGSPTTLATGQNGGFGIAIDAASVYWTNHTSGTVASVPIGGGSVATVASGQNGPSGIAVDAASVYWTNLGDGTVMKLTPK